MINTSGYQEVLELNGKEFVTNDDIVNGSFNKNLQPGSLYYHDGVCYVHAGWGPIKDPKDSAWLPIDSSVVVIKN